MKEAAAAPEANRESLQEVESALDELTHSSRLSVALVAVGVIILLASVTYSWTRLQPLERQIALLEGKAASAKSELARLEAQRASKAEILDAQTTQIGAAQSQLHELQKSIQSLRSDVSSRGDVTAGLNGVEQNTQDLAIKIGAIKSSAVASQHTQSSKLFYVIAMTAQNRATIQREIDRVRKLDTTFTADFPDVEIYGPPESLYTLVVNRTPLPYSQANALKRRAITAGFGADTWLWQSDVDYFSDKKD